MFNNTKSFTYFCRGLFLYICLTNNNNYINYMRSFLNKINSKKKESERPSLYTRTSSVLKGHKITESDFEYKDKPLKVTQKKGKQKLPLNLKFEVTKKDSKIVDKSSVHKEQRNKILPFRKKAKFQAGGTVEMQSYIPGESIIHKPLVADANMFKSFDPIKPKPPQIDTSMLEKLIGKGHTNDVNEIIGRANTIQQQLNNLSYLELNGPIGKALIKELYEVQNPAKHNELLVRKQMSDNYFKTATDKNQAGSEWVTNAKGAIYVRNNTTGKYGFVSPDELIANAKELIPLSVSDAEKINDVDSDHTFNKNLAPAAAETLGGKVAYDFIEKRLASLGKTEKGQDWKAVGAVINADEGLRGQLLGTNTGSHKWSNNHEQFKRMFQGLYSTLPDDVKNYFRNEALKSMAGQSFKDQQDFYTKLEKATQGNILTYMSKATEDSDVRSSGSDIDVGLNKFRFGVGDDGKPTQTIGDWQGMFIGTNQNTMFSLDGGTPETKLEVLASMLNNSAKYTNRELTPEQRKEAGISSLTPIGYTLDTWTGLPATKKLNIGEKSGDKAGVKAFFIDGRPIYTDPKNAGVGQTNAMSSVVIKPGANIGQTFLPARTDGKGNVLSVELSAGPRMDKIKAQLQQLGSNLKTQLERTPTNQRQELINGYQNQANELIKKEFPNQNIVAQRFVFVDQALQIVKQGFLDQGERPAGREVTDQNTLNIYEASLKARYGEDLPDELERDTMIQQNDIVIEAPLLIPAGTEIDSRLLDEQKIYTQGQEVIPLASGDSQGKGGASPTSNQHNILSSVWNSVKEGAKGVGKEIWD